MSNTSLTVQQSTAAINAAIRNANANLTRFGSYTQTALELIVAHAHGVGNGDVSGLARLCTAFGRKTKDLGRITRFMAYHTSIRIGKDKNGQFKAYLAKDDDGNKIPVSAHMVDAVRSNQWVEFDPPTDESIITLQDLDTKVGNLISFIDRLIENKAKNKKLSEADRVAAADLRKKLKEVTLTKLEGNVAIVAAPPRASSQQTPVAPVALAAGGN